MSSDDKHQHHIVPLRIYLGVAAALMVLTAVTVGVSYIPLGGFNVVVALSVAAFKASLVALYFMHLKYDRKIYLVVFLVAVIILAVFIIFTMFDTMRRDDIYEIKSGPIEQQAKIYDAPPSDSLMSDGDTLAPVEDTAQ